MSSKGDNVPAGSFGQPVKPGETYVDTKTGQTKQKNATGPDKVIQNAQQTKPLSRATTPRTSGVIGEYDAAKSDLNAIDQFLLQAKTARQSFGAGGIGQKPSTEVQFNGRTYDLKGIDAEIARIEKVQKQAKARFDAAEKVVKPLRDKVQHIKDQIDGAGDDQARKAKWQAQLPAAQAALEGAQSIPAGTKLTTSAVTAATKTAPGKVGLPKRGQVTAPTATTAEPAAAPTTPSAFQNPSARNRVGATGKTGKVTTGVGGGGNVPPPPPPPPPPPAADKTPQIDEEAIRKQYPNYSWVFDLGPEYKDTKDLYYQMLAGTENGGITMERFQALLPQSSWYRDQNVISTKRKINGMFGDVGLDSGSMSKLINDAISFKYDDTELSQAFYGQVFKKDPTTGQYVNDKAARTALNGSDAAGLRSYAKSMFMLGGDPNAVNKDIEDVLTGKITNEDWQRTIRTTAKSVYSNWSTVLDDPSMTMERLTRPWQTVAASVLEMDPSQIDMSKPEYAAAFNGMDATGKPKSMSLGEWTVKLRTDPQYGWKNTQAAKQEARNLAYNLSVAFGKII